MGDSLASNDRVTESPAVEVTGKIMVLAIIILFMVIVFVLFLHLYAKWFWWSIEETTSPPAPPRRRRRRRFVFAPGQDPAIYGGGQRSGLDASVLMSLPVLVYQSENFKDGLECAVCLSEVVDGEKARLLPKCNHGFHVDCIDMWFQSHSTCPLCRNPVACEATKCNNGTSSVGESTSESNVIGGQLQLSENFQSPGLVAVNGSYLESPNFPTNVLVWGDQTQVSSINTSLEEEGTSSSSSSSLTCATSTIVASTSGSNNRREMMVIEMPSDVSSSSLLSPSGSRCAEDEVKSPMNTRLRSLKRLLSRDKRLGPFNPGPGSIDVEQAGRGQG